LRSTSTKGSQIDKLAFLLYFKVLRTHMHYNRYIAPVLALTLFTGVGCGSSHKSAESVSLNRLASPEAQAKQIETALNAGKKVTGALVEVGFEVPLTAGEIPKYPGTIAIEDPIKLGKNTFLYAESKLDNSGLDVGVLTYDSALIKALPHDNQPVATPHEATLTLSPVYSEFRTRNGDDSKYYVISRNQQPGPNYDEASLTASQLVWTGK
jgi:hypothetical protein